MLVRRARAGDLAAVGELTVAAYAGFTLGPDDPYVAKLRDAAARDREAEVWVAEEDGRLLGAVTLCPAGSPWREVAADDESEFRMLAVAPAAQGRGAGERLVRHAVETGRAQGCSAVVLSSLPQMAAAHRLYARLGFHRSPRRDWTPVPGTDLVVFVLDL